MEICLISPALLLNRLFVKHNRLSYYRSNSSQFSTNSKCSFLADYFLPYSDKDVPSEQSKQQFFGGLWIESQ